ncbi:uncharacterized protein LOC118438195 [Folsomia candida]|uniref:Uncharacterized protein n=1 Tax=Folsomia candida TaxID=158441 RepID=A0A226F1Y7_FOLCA|nr:uncharacterized protein LOC118438195 [Folsomia candida]XP_035713953.1 uncharacterized protein LOC118438195 [Folsomia candida]XP_035713956.1 uncharacterized protein LOC118438195 [Folsomia candida]OXA63447.1 hypothetical protein Fcan01_01036 [Folsomia candida]
METLRLAIIIASLVFSDYTTSSGSFPENKYQFIERVWPTSAPSQLTIVESVKIGDLNQFQISSRAKTETFIKSKRSNPEPETPSTSPFCPWGICKFPGFLFGAFFKVPEDMLPPVPSPDLSEDNNPGNVIFIKTSPDEPMVKKPVAKPEKTVIYLLPQRDQHDYREKNQDLAEDESRNAFHDKFEVVYLTGMTMTNIKKLKKEESESKPIRRAGKRVVRKVMRRLPRRRENGYSQIVKSVTVSYSVRIN